MLLESSKKSRTSLYYHFYWILVLIAFLTLTVIWLRLFIAGRSLDTLSSQVFLPIILSTFSVLIIFIGFFLGFTEAAIFASLSSLINFFTFLGSRNPFFIINIIIAGCLLFILYQQREKERSRQNQEIIDLEEVKEEYNTLTNEYEKQKFLTIALKKRFEKFSQLGKIAEILSYTLKVDEIVSVVASKAFELIGKGERLKLFLTKEGYKALILEIEGEIKGDKLSLETRKDSKQADIIDQWVAQNRQGLLVVDTKNDFRFQTESFKMEENSIISYPFLREGGMLGLLRLSSLKSEAFSVEDLRLLSILADLAAASLKNAQLYQKTEYLATVDGLTSLYVRGHFEEMLNKGFKTACLEHNPLSLLMVDIDHFKDYNDTYGHIVGDMVLKKIADFLKEKVGDRGTVSRYGGEEFTVILPNIDKAAAIEIAEDIQVSLEHEIIYVRRKETRITVSIGVAAYPLDGMNREDLMRKVDAALLRAKREGRNKVCVA